MELDISLSQCSSKAADEEMKEPEKKMVLDPNHEEDLVRKLA